jgi:hypothetical protein
MSGAECPWCHSPVKDLRLPCPKCGKLASDLRTTDAPEPVAKAVRVPAPAPMAVPDIPDLVIPSAPVSRPATSSRPVPNPTAASTAFDDDLEIGGGDLQIDLSSAAPPKAGIARPPTPGAGFSPFDDDIGAGGPSLELDTDSMPPRVSSPAGPSSLAPLAPPPPVSHRSLPVPQAEAPPKPAVDPYEAKVLADYGAPPDAFWNAPLYAYRVMARRSSLQRELAIRKIEAERSIKRVEEALAAFGERVRSLEKGAASSMMASGLERVRQAEELLRSRDGALAAAMDAQKGTLAEIDARLAPAEVELGHVRAELARAEAARDAADEDFKRADAKLKRLDIEIRNGASARIAEREPLSADAAQKNQRRAAAEQKLAEVQRVVAVAQAKVDGIAGERSAHQARFSRASGTRSAGVDDAQTHLRNALVELGRSALSDPSAADLAAARDEIARLEEQLKKHTRDVALHETALTAYDAPKVFLGMGLVAAALLVLFGLVFFPFIYRAFAT